MKVRKEYLFTVSCPCGAHFDRVTIHQMFTCYSAHPEAFVMQADQYARWVADIIDGATKAVTA